MFGVLDQNAFHADFEGLRQERAGPDRLGEQIIGISVLVENRGRIISHSGDERDVRARQHELNRVAVHDLYGTFYGFVCVLVHEHREAARHGVTLDILIAPA